MTERLRGIGAAALLCALAVSGATAAGVPSPPRRQLFLPPPGALVTTGEPSLTVGDGRIFAANIGSIGPYSGSAAIVHVRTASPATTNATTNGQVSAAAAAPGGGFYVGGDFDAVGSASRRFLARLKTDGSADPRFRPDVNGFVAAIEVAGPDIYIAGFFTRVDGRPRAHVAELSAQTGRLIRSFDPPYSAQAIPEMLLGSHALFIAGDAPDAANPYDYYEPELIALDPRTGRREPTFHSTFFTSGPIGAIAQLGATVYVGAGDGVPNAVSRVRAFDARTGAPRTSFRGPTGSVADMAEMGGRLIVAGSFKHDVGAIAIDPRTGARVHAFACHFEGTVFSLASSHGRLWLGGLGAPFINEPGVHERILTTDAGLVRAVDRKTCGTEGPTARPDGQVNALAAAGGQLLIGGIFNTLTRTSGSFLSLDPHTLAPLPRFHPDPSLVVSDMTFAGGRVWVLGDGRASELDPVTGRLLTSFKVDVPAAYGEENHVSRFLAYEGRLYLLYDHRVLVYEMKTGRRLLFRIPLHGYTETMVAGRGALYLSGSYKRRRADGQAANLAVLRLDPVTGALDEAFDTHANGPVQSLLLRGNRLYIDGLFDFVGPERHHGLAAVDPATGKVITAFDPDPPGRYRDRTADSSVTLDGRLLLYKQGEDYDAYCEDDADDLAFDTATGRTETTRVLEAVNIAGAAHVDGRMLVSTCVNTFTTISGPSVFDTLGFLPADLVSAASR